MAWLGHPALGRLTISSPTLQQDWLNEPRVPVTPFATLRPEAAASFFSDLGKGRS